MTATFAHVAICVSDLPRSVAFFEAALGFTLDYYVDVGPAFSGLTELEGLQARAGFLYKDGLRLELIAYAHPPAEGEAIHRPLNRLGLSHMSFVVDDLVAVTERIARCGGASLAHTRLSTPKGDLIFCVDPDGGRIELWEKASIDKASTP